MQHLARSVTSGAFFGGRRALATAAEAVGSGSHSTNAKAALQKTFGYVLTGLTLYMTHEALEDAVLYRLCTTMAINAAETNEELRELLGEAPYTAGPWWNSSLRTTFGSKIVTSQFPLKGEKAGTDVRVGLVRHSRGEEHWTDFSNVLYVVIGPNAWRPLFVDATVPQQGDLAGARPKRISLVPLTDVRHQPGPGPHHTQLRA